MPTNRSEVEGDYSHASFSATRKFRPFLDPKTLTSDEGVLESSLDQENGILSQSAQSDEYPGELSAVAATSTPDLSFAASSSPYGSPARESSPSYTISAHRPQFGNAAHLAKPISDHASFIHRLNHPSRRAADQRYRSRIMPCIHPGSIDAVPDPESQTVSIGHDVVPLSALSKHGRDSTFPPRKLRGTSSLVSRTSDGSALAPVSYDTGNDSRRNKRKAQSATDGGPQIPATTLVHNGDPSATYVSASDCAYRVSSRSSILDMCDPPLKKRKCDASDRPQSSAVSARADSQAPSDINNIRSKSWPLQTRQSSDLGMAQDGSDDGQAFEAAALYPSHSACSAGSVLSYTPTEIATPISDYSPGPSLSLDLPPEMVVPVPDRGPSLDLSWIPILEPRDFHQADIPRNFSGSRDAAEARLNSLLRKEVLYCGKEEGTSALATHDRASHDTLVTDVILWILTVEPPRGCPSARSIRQRQHSYDLYEQLTGHHDSRFFAALIFSSFIFFPAKEDSNAPIEVDQADKGRCEELKEGETVAIWDYAVAAIALAVKMHRDTYPPLKPIFGNHFLALAHHNMCLKDLEGAQRQLLEHFSYNLCMPTPQAYLDELRVAVPTLQEALGSENAWEEVLGETWKQLLAAAQWPSMLRFPVSLLTATALIEAIKQVVRHREFVVKSTTRADWERLHCAGDGHMKHLTAGGPPQKISLKDEYTALDVLRATSAVIEDIRKVLGLSVRKTDECEEWLARVRTTSEMPHRSKYFSGVS
ncbi:hypothetical protein F5148DRAFT_872277 [Russula earlei]|uniref:Uncharacterized protein n=1 Tax=Russula earlei TaxID=71964 RepID=A0ACC0UA95_9AGAM|nr:hypothetical protein F5148DRAFT_872277 [Russula earlei]